MIHIVFGASEAGSLRMALKNLKEYQAEKLITFYDIFSFGPITDLHTELGQKNRTKWLTSHIEEEFDDHQQEWKETLSKIRTIAKDESIIIWVANNAHEQVGLRLVLYLLHNNTNPIVVINTTKSYKNYFDRPEIEYTVLRTGELAPEQLQVIYTNEKVNPLTMEERKVLEKEWLALGNSTETLRIWSNEEIKSVKEDFYDSYIVQQAKEIQLERGCNDFMKSARLIGSVIGNLEQYIGDSFFEYRLRMLIENEAFEMEGVLKGMRYYSIRLKE